MPSYKGISLARRIPNLTINPKLLDQKSSNFQCMLVISDSFVLQNFNIKDLMGWSQQKIESIATMGAKSIFLQYCFYETVFICLKTL